MPSNMLEWLCALFFDLKITDIFLAAFTGVLAVYTAKLFYATDILAQSERPWVGPVTVANPGAELPVGQEMKSCVVIRNTGRTPALGMRVAHDGVILDKGVSPSVPDVRQVVPKALFPNADDFYYPFRDRILT
jgi:hypothetical protein